MLAIVHYGISHQFLSSFCSANLFPQRVVCVIMALSSLAFYAMAFRVPVVSGRDLAPAFEQEN